MSLDGITLKALQLEIEKKIAGGKITRIFQPEKRVVTIEIRNHGRNYRLFLSADAAHPGLHLTSRPYQNPVQAPDFCMLLRKHLQYSILTQLNQWGMDRILELHLQGRDGQPRSLILEIMGRHSNLILLQQGMILGSIKNVTAKISRYRQILPGLPYEKPPAQEKMDPCTIHPQDVEEFLVGEKKAFRLLLDNLQGFGPLSSQELLLRSGIHPQKTAAAITPAERSLFVQVFTHFQTRVKEGDFRPSILLDPEDRILAFSALTLTESPGRRRREFSSLSLLFDYYYQEKIQREQLAALAESLSTIINNHYQKGKKRLMDLRQDLKKGQMAHEVKAKGDIITANIYRIQKGLTEIRLPDLTDPAQEVTIPLNPALRAAENAQKYYRRYQKLKKSCRHLQKEIRKLENELKYLSQVQVSIEQAQEKEDLHTIKEELEEEGYMKKSSKKAAPQKQRTTPPSFRSSQGYQIFVGRNNRENDYLTMKLAGREDIWLHVKDLAGSHVIIKRENQDPVPERTLEEAAILAAIYSRGHLSSKVPVDYTLVKHVQKPKEARPGMVYYKEYKTIQVTPDTELVEKLKKEV